MSTLTLTQRVLCWISVHPVTRWPFDMHSISFYLELGIRHISDLAGYDHILFLLVLCAIYQLHQWRALLVLVTAFTVGHSITLALTSFSVISIKSEVIEFLIPMPIIATEIHNLFIRSNMNTLILYIIQWFKVLI